MITNDATLLKVKHEVLYEVAKLAYAGRLEEERDSLPYKMVPGPQPAFRCCIYREREVIRQRIRLAEGKAPGAEDDGNIVQVINSACEGCPISRYVVTDNCQKCMGKACQAACRFGAISMGRDKSYIDPSKCKECGQCAKACPYNAIADLVRPCMKSCPVDAISVADNGTGIAVINQDKCIQCGSCVHKCPFGAIGSKTFIVDIIKKMRSDIKVFAMLAPATIGQFGADITMASWRTALKKIGFYDVVDVSLGADMTAMNEAKEWIEAKEKGEKKTTSCCPAFVNMVKKHFPEVWDCVSTTVSPMCAVSRMIKAKEPEAVTVFIGPCVAKKSECQDKSIEGNADYVLTYGELSSIMKARNVKFEPAENDSQEASIYGKKFANAGRLPEDFIEGMVCEGGCVGGPSQHRTEKAAMKDRNALLGEADERGVHENLEHYPMDTFSMHR